MRVETATALIGGLIYKPDWKFTVTDNTNRFEDSVVVRVDYPCVNSDRAYAQMGYPETEPEDRELANGTVVKAGTPTIRWDGTANASKVFMLGEVKDDIALYYVLAKFIMCIEEHEMREFLRVQSTLWSPFHPHREDGIERWASLTGTLLEVEQYHDTTFGLA